MKITFDIKNEDILRYQFNVAQTYLIIRYKDSAWLGERCQIRKDIHAPLTLRMTGVLIFINYLSSKN